MQNVLKMLLKIKNGQLSKKLFIVNKKAKILEIFLKLLWKNGFIIGYSKIPNKKLKIFLKYVKNKPVINCLKIFYKSSKKFHFSIKQLWKLNSTNKFCLISTNKGVKSLLECKRENISGQLLFIIN